MLQCLSVGLSVCWSLGLLVGRASKNYNNITKLYKTVQTITKHFGRLSGKLWQYAGASLMESSFLNKTKFLSVQLGKTLALTFQRIYDL